jgi:hypothetical protein
VAGSLPAFYIAHGGGPCFDMEWPSGNPFAGLRTYLAGFAAAVGARPRAILVVSAHWEAALPSVTASPRPPLIYDYTNFPPHTYALRYDVPGSPELAARVRELLAAAGIASEADPTRGLDHGVFVPFRGSDPQQADQRLSIRLTGPATHALVSEGTPAGITWFDRPLVGARAIRDRRTRMSPRYLLLLIIVLYVVFVLFVPAMQSLLGYGFGTLVALLILWYVFFSGRTKVL